jgi:alkanesulfonate monooxygenase SsuD/methylene tetrahydromethanopterin reductase-like flavin-dependent oxidoreductase (luciferase family)
VDQPGRDRGDHLPIAVGGRAEAALRRAGTRGDWYHSSATSAAKYAERVPVIRAAAEAAGRPMPRLTARAWTEFGEATTNHYAIRGTVDEMVAEIRAFAGLGVDHLAVWFDATAPDELVSLMDRFAREVAPQVET